MPSQSRWCLESTLAYFANGAGSRSGGNGGTDSLVSAAAFFAAAGAAAAPAPMLLGSDENVMPVSAFELRDLATLPALPWHAHSSLPPYQQPAARPGGCVMATPCCTS